MKKCDNPLCDYQVDKRKCPQFCPLCKAQMRKDPPKQPDNSNVKSNEKMVRHPTVEIEPGIYSVQYHQHNRFVF